MERLVTTIRAHRAQAQLTLTELADLSGITHKLISAIEREKTVPSTIVALKLAKALGLRVEQLFYLETVSDQGQPLEQ